MKAAGGFERSWPLGCCFLCLGLGGRHPMHGQGSMAASRWHAPGVETFGMPSLPLGLVNVKLATPPSRLHAVTHVQRLRRLSPDRRLHQGEQGCQVQQGGHSALHVQARRAAGNRMRCNRPAAAQLGMCCRRTCRLPASLPLHEVKPACCSCNGRYRTLQRLE